MLWRLHSPLKNATWPLWKDLPGTKIQLFLPPSPCYRNKLRFSFSFSPLAPAPPAKPETSFIHKVPTDSHPPLTPLLLLQRPHSFMRLETKWTEFSCLPSWTTGTSHTAWGLGHLSGTLLFMSIFKVNKNIKSCCQKNAFGETYAFSKVTNTVSSLWTQSSIFSHISATHLWTLQRPCGQSHLGLPPQSSSLTLNLTNY